MDRCPRAPLQDPMLDLLQTAHGRPEYQRTVRLLFQLLGVMPAALLDERGGAGVENDLDVVVAVATMDGPRVAQEITETKVGVHRHLLVHDPHVFKPRQPEELGRRVLVVLCDEVPDAVAEKDADWLELDLFRSWFG